MATGEHPMRSRNGDPSKLFNHLQASSQQTSSEGVEGSQYNEKHVQEFTNDAWLLNGNNDSGQLNANMLKSFHRPEYKTPHMELLDEQIRAIDPTHLEVGENEHQLEHGYTLWFSKQSASNKSFEDSLRILVTFRSVERFWKYYTHLRFPHELTGHCDYHLFKYGIKPMWEDPANREGGKCIVRVRKSIASRVWENVVLAILGEQFLVGDEICGAVMSLRYNQDSLISVWNRTADDSNLRQKMMDTLRRVVNLPHNDTFEYKKHNSKARLHRNLIDAPAQR